MKKYLFFLFLISSFSALAQIPEEEPVRNEAESLFSEDGFEQEMFSQKQEEIFREPSNGLIEDALADEEVFDSEADYNY